MIEREICREKYSRLYMGCECRRSGAYKASALRGLARNASSQASGLGLAGVAADPSTGSSDCFAFGPEQRLFNPNAIRGGFRSGC